MYDDKSYGYVLWQKPEGFDYLYHDSLYWHSKDGAKVLGMIYCPDCLPIGVDDIRACIRYDYGFKKPAYCCVCEKLICGVWSERRQLFLAIKTELEQ